ncbi:prolyl oligopeptidase family serine peptidase [Nocardia sp. NPDC058176]|uniref:prolyl oligopeptidase family serine peptidase n=1 Tax=Nocardia sp. NPDC058176 TaxID=3346368 RepID=UPI0036DCA8CF
MNAAHASDTWDTLHGKQIPDPHRWLENPDDPAAVTWLAAQRQRTDTHLDALPGQARLWELLRDTVVSERDNSPVRSGGNRRFRVRRAGPWRLEVDDGGHWRALIGATDLDHASVLHRWDPSPDGRFVAVQTSTGGSEYATPLLLVCAETGAVLRTCALTRYAPVAWRADAGDYFYVRRHGDQRGSGVYRHHVATGADDLLTGDDDPVGRFHLDLWQDRWLVITARSGTSRTTRVSIADVVRVDAPRPLSLGGLSSAGVAIDARGRAMAISTAKHELGRLLVADPSPRGGWGPWRVLVPADETAVLAGFTLADDHLLILRTRDGYAELSVHDAESGAWLRDAELPGAGTITAVGPTDEPGVLALGYTDWLRPLGRHRLDLRSGRATPAESPTPVLPGITVTRTTYRSDDGTEVPITILTPEGPRIPRPTLLTCYGGFGITFRPTYQPDLLIWVRAGGAVAVAGVRGGGERGRRWHRAGMGANKPTAFTDLHAAADWLLDSGWTRPDSLALLGGSNGGLMAAGAMVQRPTHYAAVVCANAPLDMLRYELWGLGPAWREEYGSPADPTTFLALLNYSPYYNATIHPDRRWPPTLITTGDNDTRVPAIHSYKMTAALQHGRGGPILLDVIAGKGHTGSTPTADHALIHLLAFVAHHTRLRLNDPPSQRLTALSL